MGLRGMSSKFNIHNNNDDNDNTNDDSNNNNNANNSVHLWCANLSDPWLLKVQVTRACISDYIPK